MKSRFNISYRHGSHRVYACDINRRTLHPWGFYYWKRIATIPVNFDDRLEDLPCPSYALKLLAWHERRLTTELH
jgi:hypothetical protein